MSGISSVYQKDYLWPARKPYFPRADLSCVVTAPIADKIRPEKITPDTVCRQSKEAAAAKLGACPKIEALEGGPTEACLKKLLDDNPNLLNIIQKKPSFNAQKKHNRERLKTTYQADYDHIEDDILSDLTGQPEKRIPCPLDDPEPPAIDCRAHMSGRAELFRRKRQARKDPCATKTSCTLRPRVTRRKHLEDAKDLPDYKKNVIPPWTSEYREAINKTGIEIAKELSMSKRKRDMMKLMKLLKPKMICNNQEPAVDSDS